MRSDAPTSGARQTQVGDWMGRLAASIGDLGKAVEILQGRLEPVIYNVPEPDDKALDSNPPEEALCPVAHQLRVQQKWVEDIGARVRQIMSHLEV